MTYNISALLTLTSLILLMWSCKKNEQPAPSDIDEVTSFDASFFTRFEEDIFLMDGFISNEGDLIIVGNGRSADPFSWEPYIGKIDGTNQFSWLKELFLTGIQGQQEHPLQITPLGDDNFLVCTQIKPFDPIITSHFDIKLIKVWNSNGNIGWQENIGSPDYDETNSVAIELPNANFIIAGQIEPSNTSTSENPQLSVRRVSKNGDPIWEKSFTSGIWFQQLILAHDAQAFFILSADDSAVLAPNTSMLRKFDLEGQVLWEKVVERGTFNSQSILSSEDNGIVLAHTTNAVEDLLDYDITVVKMDEDGNEEWNVLIAEGNSLDEPQHIIQTFDGNYVLLSYTLSYGNGGRDLMLTKISADGEVMWKNVYGSSEYDNPVKVLENTNGELLLLGNTSFEVDALNEQHFFLIKTNAIGNPI